MRLLFEIDKKDYGGCVRSFTRDSARSIIIKNGKVAMIHSLKYDYYKYPGGGIEPGESAVDALIRETAEEAGVRPQKLDDYESEEHFTLEYVKPETAILSNRTKDHGPKDPVMLEREARVLEMLLSEGLI